MLPAAFRPTAAEVRAAFRATEKEGSTASTLQPEEALLPPAELRSVVAFNIAFAVRVNQLARADGSAVDTVRHAHSVKETWFRTEVAPRACLMTSELSLCRAEHRALSKAAAE